MVTKVLRIVSVPSTRHYLPIFFLSSLKNTYRLAHTPQQLPRHNKHSSRKDYDKTARSTDSDPRGIFRVLIDASLPATASADPQTLTGDDEYGRHAWWPWPQGAHRRIDSAPSPGVHQTLRCHRIFSCCSNSWKDRTASRNASA